MSKRPLKVGFDLDGVILYNPVRIMRPVASFFKPFFFKKKGRDFYFPRTRLEKFFWRILHKTSFIPAAGIDDIKRLAKEKKIEPYIITARYSFLKKDFESWMKHLDVKSFCKGYFYNEKNLEPHEFKERKIKELELDFFVEDNLGVALRLARRKKNAHYKIIWIYNILDRNVPHSHKFPSLKKVVSYLEKRSSSF